MLTLIEVELRPHSGADRMEGHLLHGMFFEQIDRVDKTLAAEIHAMQRKPFSLWGYSSGGRQFVRMGIWNDRLLTVILSAFCARGTIFLNTDGFDIGEVRILDTFDARQTLTPKRSFQHFQLTFRSPTCFKAGAHLLLFPETRLIMNSLYRDLREAGGPEREEETLIAINESVRPSRYDLKTQAISEGNYRLIGFLGYCVYEVSAGLRDEMRAILYTLLNSAPFFGIGRKTTMGMGYAHVSFPRESAAF